MKFITFCLAILTGYGSLCAFFVNPKAPEDTSDFTPVMRFIVSSDSHITTIGDFQSVRLQKMIKLGYDIAEKDDEYKDLDAVLTAGDVTDQGTKIAFGSLRAVKDSVIKGDTQFLAVAASSHDEKTLGKASRDYFTEVMGQETDFHRVINGFHFIGISASSQRELQELLEDLGS